MGYQDAPYQGKGSHVALFRNNDGEKTLVIILKRDPIPIGTLLSIMKQARMEREEFIALLTSKLNKSKFHPYNFGKSTFIQKRIRISFPTSGPVVLSPPHTRFHLSGNSRTHFLYPGYAGNTDIYQSRSLLQPGMKYTP